MRRLRILASALGAALTYAAERDADRGPPDWGTTRLFAEGLRARGLIEAAGAAHESPPSRAAFILAEIHHRLGVTDPYAALALREATEAWRRNDRDALGRAVQRAGRTR